MKAVSHNQWVKVKPTVLSNKQVTIVKSALYSESVHEWIWDNVIYWLQVWLRQNFFLGLYCFIFGFES